MNDHVSWGLYISNMAFLVGVAAAAVMLVLPAYVLHDVDFSRAVLIAEGVAVSALVMCLGFVMANSPGYPWKWWRLTPVIGLLNWPNSMLAWDVIMLNGYLVLNLAIPFYILYSHFIGREPSKKKYVPLIYIVGGLGGEHSPGHRVPLRWPPRPPVLELRAARPPLPGVRLHRRACVHDPVSSGSSGRRDEVRHPRGAIQKLATATTVAAQVNLVMLLSELVYEFYMPTHHGISARYLFFGLGEHHALVPWIGAGIVLNVAGDA